MGEGREWQEMSMFSAVALHDGAEFTSRSVSDISIRCRGEGKERKKKKGDEGKTEMGRKEEMKMLERRGESVEGLWRMPAAKSIPLRSIFTPSVWFISSKK